jgi:hypothetical protein
MNIIRKKLSEVDREALIEGEDAVKAALALLEKCKQRQVERLATAELDPAKLLVERAKLEGMTTLIYDFTQALKNHRSK